MYHTGFFAPTFGPLTNTFMDYEIEWGGVLFPFPQLLSCLERVSGDFGFFFHLSPASYMTTPRPKVPSTTLETSRGDCDSRTPLMLNHHSRRTNDDYSASALKPLGLSVNTVTAGAMASTTLKLNDHLAAISVHDGFSMLSRPRQPQGRRVQRLPDAHEDCPEL